MSAVTTASCQFGDGEAVEQGAFDGPLCETHLDEAWESLLAEQRYDMDKKDRR